MPSRRILQPAAEPLTLAQAKQHLKVEYSEEDDVIRSLLTAAREQAEHRMGRSIMPCTWCLTLPGFPSERTIGLPWPEILEVTAVTYYNEAGVQQTWPASNYFLANAERLLCLENGLSWPACQTRPDAVSITYQAGWENADHVPSSVTAWIKLALADMFAQRRRSAEKPTVPHQFVDGLLAPFVVYGGV